MPLILVSGGTGRHAAVVYEAAMLAGLAVMGYLSIEAARPAPLFDCRWLGDLLQAIECEQVDGSEFIVACGSNAHRRRAGDRLLQAGGTLRSVIHPASIISPSATIGPGSVVLAGAVVGTCAVVGVGVIINHAASIGHDCHVGDYANISPGARLAGGVRLGAGVFVGLNAAARQGTTIGENAVVGMGAAVTRDIEPGQTVVGVPARPMTSLDA